MSWRMEGGGSATALHHTGLKGIHQHYMSAAYCQTFAFGIIKSSCWVTASIYGEGSLCVIVPFFKQLLFLRSTKSKQFILNSLYSANIQLSVRHKH